MTLKQQHRRSRCRKVAVILDSTYAAGRNAIRGIGEYIRQHGPWSIYLDTYGLQYPRPKSLQGWDGDGIIARVANKRIASTIKKTGLPVVDVLGLVPEAGFPLLHIDNAAASVLAAEHLLDLGLQQFAYCGLKNIYWSNIRRDAFQKTISDAGYKSAVHYLPSNISGARSWEKAESLLARWLCNLPKPVGIMTCNDRAGLFLLESCRRGGVDVPDDVAVIGVDNDESFCMIADPPLSSVTTNHDRVGYEAAVLLERLMSGYPPPDSSTLIAPQGVAARASTDVLSIDDPEIASIIRFARENACDGITLEDVVRFSGWSRSTLIRKTDGLLGRTLHDEIIRVRLKRVRELLAESNLPINTVSRMAGFNHRQYLGKVFKDKYGETLAEYRRRSQL